MLSQFGQPCMQTLLPLRAHAMLGMKTEISTPPENAWSRSKALSLYASLWLSMNASPDVLPCFQFHTTVDFLCWERLKTWFGPVFNFSFFNSRTFFFSNAILCRNPMFAIDKSQASLAEMVTRTQGLISYLSFPPEKCWSSENRVWKLLQVRELIGKELDSENWNGDVWADPYGTGAIKPLNSAQSSLPAEAALLPPSDQVYSAFQKNW